MVHNKGGTLVSELLKFCEDSFGVLIDATHQPEKLILNMLISQEMDDGDELAIITYKHKAETIRSDLEDFFQRNDRFNSEDIDRVKIIDPEQRSATYIIELLNKDEYSNKKIILLGVERLIESYQGEAIIKRDFRNIKINLFSNEQIKWEQVIELLKELKKEIPIHIQKLISILFLSTKSAEQIIRKYQDDELEITFIGSPEEDVAFELLKNIVDKSLTEGLNYIAENSQNLSPINIKIAETVVYIKNGLKSEALEILKEIYNKIENSEKLFFAQLLTSEGFEQEALNILIDLKHKDPWIPSLAKALISASKGMENNQREKLINELLSMSDDNYLLQEAANFFDSIEKYEESAKCWRKLFIQTEDYYYDLVARVAEILRNPPEKGRDAESYILSVAVEKQELFNEAYYRVALVWKFLYNSEFKYYENLERIRLNIDFQHALTVITEKLNILRNNGLVESHLKLKPHTKEYDIDKLGSIRLNTLVSGLELLFLDDQGYILLQEFIDGSQSIELWEKHLLTAISKEIEDWEKYDLNELAESIGPKTLVDEELNSDNAVIAMRKLKERSGNEKRDSLDSRVNAFVIACEGERNKLNEFWIRYEASLTYTFLGEFQKANNHALWLLNYYNKTQDPTLKDYAFALGISAWANSQYRLGRIVDGIICAIVSIRKGLELKNYYLIENGLTILFKWLATKEGRVSLKQKFSTFQQAVSFLKDPDSVYTKIEGALVTESWEEACDLLRPLVYVPEENQDSLWAGHLSNYISASLNISRVEECVQLLMKYSLKAAEKIRSDVRWQAIYMWCQVLLFNNDSFNTSLLNTISQLLNIAINDLEKQRGYLYHKPERAALGDKSQSVYRFYLEIQLLINKLKETSKEEKLQAEKEALETFVKVSPRAISEAKQYVGLVSKNMEIKANEYKKLYEELMIAESNVDNEEYKNKRNRLAELQKDLQENHPYFKSLSINNFDNFNLIQEKMNENQVFYQYVICNLGIVYLLITKDKIEIGHVLTDTSMVINSINSLGTMMSEGTDAKSLQNVKKICENISEVVFGPILREKIDKATELVICPDMKVPYMSSSLLRSERDWIVNEVRFIRNILDVSLMLMDESPAKIFTTDKTIVSLGSPVRPKGDAVNIAKSWVEKMQEPLALLIEGLDHKNERLTKLLEETKPRLFVIIAHGVSDPTESNVEGASTILGIEGSKKKILSGEELTELIRYSECNMLITCSSGQPEIGNIESDTGLWASLQSIDTNIIVCRWDVSITPSLEVLLHILSDQNYQDKPIAELLCMAQSKIASSDDFAFPSAWAALEYWGE